MDLQKRFEKFIAGKQLFSKDDVVLLAVSGGVDSVVMSELFHRSKFKFAIAHSNFRLRGKESDKDELFVRKLAEKYNVPFFVSHFDTNKSAASLKLSIQETARKLRYDWFAKLLEEHHFSSIATAHHLNDSIETFFINLLRGTGISGLRGILPSHDFPRTIRPVLFAKKEELENFAKKKKIKFREDQSNETDKYLRNRIRHHLMPVLLELNPQFEKVMERTLQNLAFAEKVVNDKLQNDYLLDFTRSDKNATLSFDLNDLNKSGFPVEMLTALVQSFGFNSSQADDIWNATSPGKQVTAGNYTLTSDRKKIILSQKNPGAQASDLINEKDKDFRSPSGTIKLSSKKYSPKVSIPAKPYQHAIDKGKLSFPLSIRKWEKGDYFFPLGMTGRKKISDFLIDKKVSRPDKEKTCVLLSGKDIVCVLGHRIDERFKVTSGTKEIYLVSLKK